MEGQRRDRDKEGRKLVLLFARVVGRRGLHLEARESPPAVEMANESAKPRPCGPGAILSWQRVVGRRSHRQSGFCKELLSLWHENRTTLY